MCKVLGSQKIYADFCLHSGVGTPNLHIVQGPGVLISTIMKEKRYMRMEVGLGSF